MYACIGEVRIVRSGCVVALLAAGGVLTVDRTGTEESIKFSYFDWESLAKTQRSEGHIIWSTGNDISF